MAGRKHAVGIEVEARLDRSVSRAFSNVEQQTKRIGRDTRNLGNDTRNLAQDTRRLGRDSNQTSTQFSRLNGRFDHVSLGLRKYANNVGLAIRQQNLLRRSANKAGDSVLGLGGQLTALAGGAIGAGTIAAVMELEEQYERLGSKVGKSREEMTKMRKEMFATAQQSDIRVDYSEMLAGFVTIVDKTGDIKFAQENMANLGRVIRSSGSKGEDVGKLFYNLYDKFALKTPEEILAVVDMFTIQGDIGSFELKDFAAESASVFAAYGAMGRSGPEAAREAGAMFQMANKGSGSEAEAASSLDATLSDLIAKHAEIEELGVQVFDEDALALGKKKFRPAPDILKDFMVATDSDVTEYTKYFGDEAIRFMHKLASESDRAKFNEFLAVNGDGAEVTARSKRMAQTAKATMTSLQNTWMSVADENLAEPISSLANTINSLEPETLKNTVNIGAAVAATVGTLWVGKKVVDVGVGIRDFVTGGDKSTANDDSSNVVPNLISGNGNLNAGVQLVYVSNMPKIRDFFRDGGGQSDDHATRAGNDNSLRVHVTNIPVGGFMRDEEAVGDNAKHVYVTNMPLARDFMQIGGPPPNINPSLNTLVGAITSIGDIVTDESLSTSDKVNKAGGSIGFLSGMASGAWAGGVMGTAVPFIGNAVGIAVGGSLGGIIGGLIGNTAGNEVGNWIDSNDQPGDVIKETNQFENATQQIKTIKEKEIKKEKKASVIFAPVFNITGEVSDIQIKKLEKMIQDLQKKMTKQMRINEFSFSD